MESSSLDSQEVLRKFVSMKSSFLDVPDGGEVIVQYMGVEQVKTQFKGTPTESLRYRLIHDGVEKYWDRTHRELAKQMMAFQVGDFIRIRRTGQRNQTKYFLEKIE